MEVWCWELCKLCFLTTRRHAKQPLGSSAAADWPLPWVARNPVLHDCIGLLPEEATLYLWFSLPAWLSQLWPQSGSIREISPGHTSLEPVLLTKRSVLFPVFIRYFVLAEQNQSTEDGLKGQVGFVDTKLWVCVGGGHILILCLYSYKCTFGDLAAPPFVMRHIQTQVLQASLYR